MSLDIVLCPLVSTPGIARIPLGIDQIMGLITEGGRKRAGDGSGASDQKGGK